MFAPFSGTDSSAQKSVATTALAPLLHALSPAFVLSHSLAGGLVLVAEMVVLCVVPTVRSALPFSLFSSAALMLSSTVRGLTTVVAGRSATLRLRRQSGCEKSEGESAVDGMI